MAARKPKTKPVAVTPAAFVTYETEHDEAKEQIAAPGGSVVTEAPTPAGFPAAEATLVPIAVAPPLAVVDAPNGSYHRRQRQDAARRRAHPPEPRHVRPAVCNRPGCTTSCMRSCITPSMRRSRATAH